MRVTDTVCASEGVGQNKIALTLDLSMWEVRLTVCGLSVGYEREGCASTDAWPQHREVSWCGRVT